MTPDAGSLARVIGCLAPQSKKLVETLVRQLAERDGVDMPALAGPMLHLPSDGIPLWKAKLKQEGYAVRTIETYMLTVKNYLTIQPKPTAIDVQTWLAQRLEVVSAARVSTDMKALKSFFGYLFENGLWPVNPVIKLKAIKLKRKERKIPELEDIVKLMSYKCLRERDTDKFQTLIYLLVTTGLRISEAGSLRRSDVDFVHGEIKIIGKGGDEGVVPLLPTTSEVLRGYIDRQSDGSEYVFPGDTVLGYMSIHAFEKSLRHACKVLGLKKITPHMLRHFFANYALEGGAKLEVVSKILRHKSVAITADIYRHVNLKEMHSAMLFAPFGQAAKELPPGDNSEVQSAS